MKTSGNTILMTGGGSGIGEALAHRFHDRGDTVIIAGRRREALEKAAEGRERIHVVTLDVEDAAAVDAFAKQIVADFPALNVLFNNAGIMKFEDLTGHRDLADAEATLTTNILGPIRLTNALIDHLIQQPDAAIVNVTSASPSCRWSLPRPIRRPRRRSIPIPCRCAPSWRARSR